MTLKTRRERSKLRDLLIIIRLFIRCIGILSVNGLKYVVRKLCTCIQYKPDDFVAQRKEIQLIASIKCVDVPRRISKALDQRCLKNTNQAENEMKSGHKPKDSTSPRSENSSRLKPPPVKELIFTKDDVWKVKKDTSRLTPAQVRVYSGDSVKSGPDDKRNSHNNWVNYSPISFLKDVKHSAQQGQSSSSQVLTNNSVKRCNLEWLQRGKRHWQPNKNFC